MKAFAWNPVVFVSCGRQNTAAITQRGQLYTWGANSNGQLGYKIAGKYNASPKQVPELTFEGTKRRKRDRRGEERSGDTYIYM